MNIKKTKKIYNFISIGLIFLFFFPFFWMIMGCFKNDLELFKPLQIFPNKWDFSNFRYFFKNDYSISFVRHLFNSIWITISQTILSLSICIPFIYVFSIHHFKYQKVLLFIFINILFIPKQIFVIPLFEWMNHLSLLDNPKSLIFIGALDGLTLLYFYKVFKKIPNHFFNLYRLEGYSEYSIFFKILPLIKDFIITYGVIYFILAYHQHLLPIILLQNKINLPLTPILNSLVGNSRTPYGIIMVASVFSLIPPFILFFIFRKKFYFSFKKA